MRTAFLCLFLVACGHDAAQVGDASSGSSLPWLEGGAVFADTGDARAHQIGDFTDAGAPLDAGDGRIPDAAIAETPLDVLVLDDVTSDAGVRYQLLKLTRAPKAATYAQWFPPKGDARRPVVVATKPYDGIDWTRDAVDARWAALGAGAHPDVDSPDAGPMPGTIGYTPLSPQSVDDANLFRLNNMGTLLLYGRFYAGGDVQNDIDDMTTGLDFLEHAERVDTSRIGIWGGSWGGFEAVFGAAYARASVRPSVGAALAPVADFEREVDFVTRDLPMRYTLQASRDATATFFAPYLRRIAPTQQARGGYEGLRGVDLATRINVPFLLIHEDWDTLVSFDQSTRLVELAPKVFQAMWLLHSAPPLFWDQTVNSHGPLMTSYGSAILTVLTSFMLTHLADPDQVILTAWEDAKMREMSTGVRDRQREGKDVSFYAARLWDIADPRITVVNVGTNAQRSGAEAVASEVNAVWGTSHTAATVRAALAVGLPPVN